MQTQSEFEAMCDAVFKSASRAAMAVLIVPGAIADDLGGQGLQIVCNRSERNLITDRDSKFHSGTIFRPQAEEAKS